jgi:transposase
MTPSEIKDAVRTLQAQGQSLREISRGLKLSRNTVRRILRHSEKRRPATEPALDALTRERLERAFERARGNAARVQQLLAEEHALDLPYSTLTRWIRQAALRAAPKRAGEYHFAPGEEMQHDTSPHRLVLGGKEISTQCAGLVLAYSRRLFIQYYPRYRRFEAKHFLLEAARFMHGTCPVCVIDNTSVMIASGSGADALIAPEMAAFARSLGFAFRAHAVGHPDRKGRIERPFAYVERNFLPGRSFADFEDLNAQALAWCREVANAKPKRVLGMSAEAAYLIEKPHLSALPALLPPVYELFERIVDLHGFVSVDTVRYSVPERLIGRAVTVYKYATEIRISQRGIEIARHPRQLGARDARSVLPGHHSALTRAPRALEFEAQLLLGNSATLERYAAALKQRAHGRGVRALRRLLELKRSYPQAPFEAAVEQALNFGLFDLGRLETLILKRVAGDFFALDLPKDDSDA